MGEKTPLLLPHVSDGLPVVEPLRYSETWTAADMLYRAFEKNTEKRYFNDADFGPHIRARRDKPHVWWPLLLLVRAQRALTVDHGNALLSYARPGEKTPGGWLVNLLRPLIRLAMPKECRKRRNEFVEAMKRLEEEALGDRAKEMFTLAGLGTAPEAQGKGYASALVRCLLAMADAEGRATSVMTTDAAGFYALHGFVLVGETWIAKDNPKYDGPPVPVRVMIREARKTG
ncbi:uncharacterized protein BXZ73DRAFT_110466 [Epithele typhae]|uniref:uncharacterized protein n=1 Tax=Epithele typhae TaxID=378194 RepID=UPI0020084CFD|nr:uncharacterized protein BXZ73DRAFT_110466 [Epithele typhae]KAH9906589.1 hypothetical protein BXZ73DRAFT_110466 [Epithele typhae]